MNLDGKNVLLIAPRFFGYETEIKRELERRGARVDFLADRPFDSEAGKVIAKYIPRLQAKLAISVHLKSLNAYGRTDYAAVILINGQTVDPQLIGQVRRCFPNAYLLHYIWDSVSNRESIQRLFPYFDNVFTFDKIDAAKYDLSFRPLFYTPAFQNLPFEDPEYDVSFIGTAHTDRARIVQRIDKSLTPRSRRYWYLYLQAPWVFHANRVINPAFHNLKLRDFRFQPLPRDEIQRVFSCSSAILDIEHPRQTGLTMRTFEALGAGKKLATTNSEIKEYDFYDPRNIQVLDRKNPTLNPEFLVEPYKPISSDLYRKYSIAGWLDEILGLVT